MYPGQDAGWSWEEKTNAMTIYAMAPSAARASTAMALTKYIKRVHYLALRDTYHNDFKSLYLKSC